MTSSYGGRVDVQLPERDAAVGHVLPWLRHESPEWLITKARHLHAPIATFCLFSGGSDSTVLAHRCRDLYSDLVFIDTGTALPGVVEHVRATAEFIGKPLRIYSAGDAFRRMVLGGTPVTRGPRRGQPEEGHGFPGPGQHGKAYTRLKERQIDALLRDTKSSARRNDTVLFLTGVRRAESARRSTREPITKVRAKVFCNPLLHWSNEQMRVYRERVGFPVNEVAALLHRSGECNCGAFASPGEREMLQSLWPEWFEVTIASLEREARVAGIAACRWGERPGKPSESGPLCSSCTWRQEQLDLAT